MMIRIIKSEAKANISTIKNFFKNNEYKIATNKYKYKKLLTTKFNEINNEIDIIKIKIKRDSKTVIAPDAIGLSFFFENSLSLSKSKRSLNT